MSKIYEALEQAQKERKGIEPIVDMEVPIPEPEPMPVSNQESEIYSFELEMEEEMLRLYHNIESLIPDRRNKVIQFIAAGEGEGTSTIAREFARVTILRLGHSVLLLDADRQNPTQHFFCNVSPEFCLDDVLQNGTEELDKALYQVGASNLFVSLVSRNSNSGGNIFDSPVLEQAWLKLKDRFDFILIDSPPATTSPDAFSVFRKADGVVIVVEADRTRWPVVESVREKIVQHGGNILGVVLNKRKFYIPDFVYRRL
jgi:Mrp family chromosome partitioning ATPase